MNAEEAAEHDRLWEEKLNAVLARELARLQQTVAFARFTGRSCVFDITEIQVHWNSCTVMELFYTMVENAGYTIAERKDVIPKDKPLPAGRSENYPKRLNISWTN